MTVSCILPPAQAASHPSASAKSDGNVIADCASLLKACSASGDYVNPRSEEELAHRSSCENSHLIARYNECGQLMGCALMMDKDHWLDGIVTKDFMISEVEKAEGIAIPHDTKLFWISSVCTSPAFRGSGCASSLFDCAEHMAETQTGECIIIAESVRAANAPMLSFSEHRGYSLLDGKFTKRSFGIEAEEGSLPWKILYKILRHPA